MEGEVRFRGAGVLGKVGLEHKVRPVAVRSQPPAIFLEKLWLNRVSNCF